jgi:hypothetical protein
MSFPFNAPPRPMPRRHESFRSPKKAKGVARKHPFTQQRVQFDKSSGELKTAIIPIGNPDIRFGVTFGRLMAILFRGIRRQRGDPTAGMNLMPLFGRPVSISGNDSAFTFSVPWSTFQQILDYEKSQLTAATRLSSDLQACTSGCLVTDSSSTSCPEPGPH